MVTRDEYIAAGRAAKELPFTVLLMAAMRAAESDDRMKLEAAFPATASSMAERDKVSSGRLPGEVPMPVKCSNCTTSYDACTTKIRKNEGACCSTCRYTATHRQNAWESAFGCKLTTDVFPVAT